MNIVIVPVLIIGIILGFIELIFVHQDESGMGWLKHGFHAIPTMIIFIFISMNIDYVTSLFNWQPTMWVTVGIRVFIGIIAAIKISAAAAVAGRVGEKFPHTIAIAVLVMVAPYAWDLVLCNISFVQSLSMNGCSAAAS